MTFWQADVAEALGCSATEAQTILDLVHLGGSLSSECRDGLNARYSSAREALRILGKL